MNSTFLTYTIIDTIIYTMLILIGKYSRTMDEYYDLILWIQKYTIYIDSTVYTTRGLIDNIVGWPSNKLLKYQNPSIPASVDEFYI